MAWYTVLGMHTLAAGGMPGEKLVGVKTSARCQAYAAISWKAPKFEPGQAIFYTQTQAPRAGISKAWLTMHVDSCWQVIASETDQRTWMSALLWFTASYAPCSYCKADAAKVHAAIALGESVCEDAWSSSQIQQSTCATRCIASLRLRLAPPPTAAHAHCNSMPDHALGCAAA